MSKIAVVYWSGTGNTEAMAKAVLEGINSSGAQGELFSCAEFDASMIEKYDAVAFGCPAMGAEQLEDFEFEPMFSPCVPKLAGKRLGLFGSYGWGDGEWMRSWEKDVLDAGAILASNSVICSGQPDAVYLKKCNNLGKSLLS